MGKTSRKPLRHNYVDIIGIVELNGDDVEIYSENKEHWGTIFGPLAEEFKQYEGRIVKFRAKEIPQYLVDWQIEKSDKNKIFLVPHTPESPYPSFTLKSISQSLKILLHL